jgi:hypothetical protein
LNAWAVTTKEEKMEYVNVIIITPDSKEYDAKVDKDADDEALLADLVAEPKLGLPTADGNTTIEYGLNLIGGARIREGITIQIYRIRPPTVKDIQPRK